MTTEQLKEKEIVYLWFFLIQMRLPRTVRQAQAVLAISTGLWTVTAEDVARLWPGQSKTFETGALVVQEVTS